jgi:YD repeat-containing protein
MLKLLSSRQSRGLWCAFAMCMTLCGLTAYAGEVVYEYDDAGRLKRTIYPNANQRAYTLDAAGNRTSVQVAAQVGGTITIPQVSYTVNEDVGTVQVTVTRNSTNGLASVQYATANGTAVAGSDYTATSGTLTWASGNNAAQTITIPILNDTANESAETFTITLSAPTGGALLATATATFTINDNDTVNAVPIFRYRFVHNWAQHLMVRTTQEMAPYTDWIYEGIGFYLYPIAIDANTVALHHCYIGGTSDHFVTSDAGCVGYTYIGFLGYISTIERPGTVPIYEFYHYGQGGHMTTTGFAEGANNGFTYLGLQGYAYLGPNTGPNAAALNSPATWSGGLAGCTGWCAWNGDVPLTWNAVTGATRYELERSTWDYNIGGWTPYTQIYSGTTPSRTIAEADRSWAGDAYRVRACIDGACSPYSASLYFYIEFVF